MNKKEYYEVSDLHKSMLYDAVVENKNLKGQLETLRKDNIRLRASVAFLDGGLGVSRIRFYYEKICSKLWAFRHNWGVKNERI